MSLIECVPNISDGQHAEILAACEQAIRGAGAALLDASADASHNRSVFTFVGSPDVVSAAALAVIDQAVASIDLRRQRGVHPRIGAIDVVPFVPLAGATMQDAVDMARHVGAVAAARHNLPVYLYEEAASTPERRNLATVRRGGFEGLAQKLQAPHWAPDFGPAVPHPSAGATAIGARRPLVAFNINLATDDLAIARRLAAAVRESSGGFPFVKAMGVPLADRGIVQVSMNLTDVTVTPILPVFEAVERAAARLGVAVLDSELIGLAPAVAFPADPARTLLLRGFGESRILEKRIESVLRS